MCCYVALTLLCTILHIAIIGHTMFFRFMFFTVKNVLFILAYIVNSRRHFALFCSKETNKRWSNCSLIVTAWFVRPSSVFVHNCPLKLIKLFVFFRNSFCWSLIVDFYGFLTFLRSFHLNRSFSNTTRLFNRTQMRACEHHFHRLNMHPDLLSKMLSNQFVGFV